MEKHALLSVYDKTGIVTFAQELVERHLASPTTPARDASLSRVFDLLTETGKVPILWETIPCTTRFTARVQG